jgi:hypothetical protein
VNGGAAVLTDAACTIDNAIARHVYHEFSAGDFTTLTANEYLVQFKVVRADTKIVYVPDQDRNYFTVKVKEPI